MSAKQAETIHWKTKDGRLIAVKDMSDSHLLNAHGFMQSRLEDCSELMSSAWSFLTTLQGEMAQDCMEREIDKIESEYETIITWVWLFKEELDRRKLVPLKGAKE